MLHFHCMFVGDIVNELNASTMNANIVSSVTRYIYAIIGSGIFLGKTLAERAQIRAKLSRDLADHYSVTPSRIYALLREFNIDPKTLKIIRK